MGSLFARASRTRPGSVNIKRPPVPEHLKASLDGQGQEKPNQELLERLKDVYVSSQTDVVTQENPYGAERAASKLPQERRASDTDSFNVGLVASPGYLTVPQVVEIFAKRKENKEAWPAAKVASSFQLDPVHVEHLLRYFNDYSIITIEKPDLSPKMEFHNLHE